nr:MAG TPA: hypothetical protein [Crassvirales sp.]
MGKLTHNEIDDYMDEVPMGKRRQKSHPLHRKHRPARDSDRSC